MNNGVLFLAIAILMDVFANILLKKSDGFKRKFWGIGAILCIVSAFSLLAQAVKTMDLSIAYALWGAVGMLLTTSIDIAFYRVRLKSRALVGIVFMVAGIVLIQSLN